MLTSPTPIVDDLTALFPTTDKRVVRATLAAVTENFGVEDHDLNQDDGARFRRAVEHLRGGFGQQWQADYFVEVMTRDHAPATVLEREERIVWGTTVLVVQSFLDGFGYNEEEEEVGLVFSWAFERKPVHEVVSPGDLIRRLETLSADGKALSDNLQTLYTDLVRDALRSTVEAEPDEAPVQVRARVRL